MQVRSGNSDPAFAGFRFSQHLCQGTANTLTHMAFGQRLYHILTRYPDYPLKRIRYFSSFSLAPVRATRACFTYSTAIVGTAQPQPNDPIRMCFQEGIYVIMALSSSAHMLLGITGLYRFMSS